MGTFQEISKAKNVDENDIIHKAMRWQIGFLPAILLWGLILETLHACDIIKGSFDLQSFFAAVLFYEGGVATLLGAGTVSMFFRKTAPTGT